MFDKVTKHLDVIETDYFGLTFRDKTGKKVRNFKGHNALFDNDEINIILR